MTISTTLPGDARTVLGNEAMLSQLRKDLLHFAVLQLRNRELAEDVVQEALAASDRFESRASVKTWLFTILKNKILDVFRDRWNKNRVDLIDATDETDFESWKYANL